MHVETYELVKMDSATGQLVYDEVSDDALRLIDALGLTGQQRRIAKATAPDEGEIDGRNPYRKISPGERAVFAAVYSSREALTEYDEGTIPLRALQVAAHASTLGMELRVWHDPASGDGAVLIGTRKVRRQGSTYDTTEEYLLAWWTAEPTTLDALRAVARERIVAKVEAEIVDAEAKIRLFRAAYPGKLDLYLLTGEDYATYLPNLNFT